MNTQDLQRELLKRAMEWALADRICDDHMTTVDRIKREVDAHSRDGQPTSELRKQLEYEQIGFKLACQRESQCDDELHAFARRLAEELEKVPSVAEHDRVLHVLSVGRALCAFSSEVPSQWPAGHQWTSVGELHEGVTKIEQISCASCAEHVRPMLALLAKRSEKTP